MSSRWPKGVSGNPAGKGQDEASRRAFREALAKGVEGVISKMLMLAAAGDTQAAKLVLDRVVPPLRPVAEHISLPALASATSHTEAVREIVRALADGVITPDTGASLIGAIAAASKVEEVDELRKQVAALHAARFA